MNYKILILVCIWSGFASASEHPDQFGLTVSSSPTGSDPENNPAGLGDISGSVVSTNPVTNEEVCRLLSEVIQINRNNLATMRGFAAMIGNLTDRVARIERRITQVSLVPKR